MYTLSVVLLGLFIVPWFLLLDTRSTWGIALATVIAFGILWAPVTAVLGTLCSEIFSANVRYTGITLGYQLGAALAGGTAPLIATGLLAKYDGDWDTGRMVSGGNGGDFTYRDFLRQPLKAGSRRCRHQERDVIKPFAAGNPFTLPAAAEGCSLQCNKVNTQI